MKNFHRTPKQEGITRRAPQSKRQREAELLRRKEYYAGFNAVACTAGMIWARVDSRADEGRNE